MNAAISQYPLKVFCVVRIEDTKQVNAVLRGRFKTWEYVQPLSTSLLAQLDAATYSVMIGDSDHFNTETFTGEYQGFVVGRFVCITRQLIVCHEILVWVYLKRTFVESSSIGQTEGGFYRLVRFHVQS